jgi:non-ribosomal peptide synthase protein (TIGR01720 family)
MSLTVEETHLLLQEVPRSYGSNILELLLTAVVQTLANWVGSQQIRLDMEGHGREELGAETLDVSRTMGWFTSIYPVLFTLPQQGGHSEWIKTIKEHMQSVPHKGIGYGLLRYCSYQTGTSGQASPYSASGDAELREQLVSAPPSQVCFNYQGQFDQVRHRPSSGEEALEVAPESSGATGGPQNQRRYLLELIALVVGEQLHLEWVYSKQQYRPTTIERLADGVAQALRELLAYCVDEVRP